MAAGYRWYVGDLRTGKIARQVDLVDARWSVPFLGAGSLEGSFPLESGEWPTARADAPVAKAFIAVSYVDPDGDETFIEGGPLWTASHSLATGVLSLGGAGLWSYFDHRKLLPVLAKFSDATTASLSYTGSLALIAKRLVQEAQAHTGGTLPIVLPDDADLIAPGDPNDRNYPGYELGWVGERLKQLTEVIGGPEVQFVPRRRADDGRYLEWVMRIGTADTKSMLYRSGLPHVIDATVTKSSLKDLRVSASGNQMAMRMWAAGQGEAEGRPIEGAQDSTLIDLGYPLLEGEVQATDSVSETSTLQAHITEGLAQSARPVETWQADVDRDSRRLLSVCRPGDWLSLKLGPGGYVPPGEYDTRITSMSGGDGSTISLDLSERLGDL